MKIHITASSRLVCDFIYAYQKQQFADSFLVNNTGTGFAVGRNYPSLPKPRTRHLQLRGAWDCQLPPNFVLLTPEI